MTFDPSIRRLRGLWAIAQSTARAFAGVVVLLFFDVESGDPERVEDIAVQQVVAQSPVEAFTVPVHAR